MKRLVPFLLLFAVALARDTEARACGLYQPQQLVAFTAIGATYNPIVPVVVQQPVLAAAQSYSYAPAVQAVAVVPEVAYQTVQSYGLAQAVEFLQTAYGCTGTQAVQFLRVHGHQEAVVFNGNAEAVVVGGLGRGRRAAEIVADNGGRADVRVGRPKRRRRR